MWMCMCKFKLKDSMGYYDEDLPIDIMIIIFRALNSHLHIHTAVFEPSLPFSLRVCASFSGNAFVCVLICVFVSNEPASSDCTDLSLLLLIFTHRKLFFFRIQMTLNRLARLHDIIPIFDIQTSCLRFARQTKPSASHRSFCPCASQLFFTV